MSGKYELPTKIKFVTFFFSKSEVLCFSSIYLTIMFYISSERKEVKFMNKIGWILEFKIDN